MISLLNTELNSCFHENLTQKQKIMRIIYYFLFPSVGFSSYNMFIIISSFRALDKFRSLQLF